MSDKTDILWTAMHFGGRTEHGLDYTLTAIGYDAEIEASWWGKRSRQRVTVKTYIFDDHRIIRLLPTIRAMLPKYEATMEDLDHQILTVEVDGERIERKIYGSGFVRMNHPEIHPFCEFFDWVHFVVMSRLDWPTEKRPRHPKLEN